MMFQFHQSNSKIFETGKLCSNFWKKGVPLRTAAGLIICQLVFCNSAISSESNASANGLVTNSVIAFKQNLVSGEITDSAGQPLAGITISLKNTNTRVLSDSQGKYAIDASSGDVLIFSFMGMTTKEAVVGGNGIVNMVMESSSTAIEEVVAIGYGVQKKVSITNAVSSISGEDIATRNSPNLTQALQGKLSGLTIIDRGGAPGAQGFTARIRGITSLNDNNPLVLVDGVPGDMSLINPSDIESVSVLKDAASTAIYGSRASAGVILVTTKGAQGGDLTLSYDGYAGFSRANNTPKHMDAITYMIHQNQANINTTGEPVFTDEYISQWPSNHEKDPDQYPEPNVWQEVMLKPAFQQSHTLTLAGGSSEKISNRLSIRHLREDGVLPNYGFNVTELRTKNDYKVFEKLTLSSNINLRLNEREYPVSEWDTYNRMFQNSQWGVPYYSDGSYGLSADGNSPLVNAKERGFSNSKKMYLSGIFKADYQLNDVFNFLAQYSTQYGQELFNSFENKFDFTDKLHPSRRMFAAVNKMRDYRNWSREDGIDFHLGVKKSFGLHKINGLLGYSEIMRLDNWGEGYRQDFYNNELQSISMGADDPTQSATGGNSQWGLRSIFSRWNYEYDDRYLLEANARYDGSSRFADGNRFGFFPSFSVGWRLSNEEFWSGLKDVVNEFKIRGSWGQVGSQQVGLYSFMQTYNQTSYSYNGTVVPGFRQTVLANQDISWETTTQSNIGVDGYLFDNQLSFSFDYYKKRTKDILLLVPIPSIVGLAPTNQNAGVVENQGMEFQIQGNKSFGDFKIDLGFNVNYNKNKVIDLAGTGPHISAFGNSDYRTITSEGLPINSYYGFQTDGFFQTQQEVDSYAKWDGSVGVGDIKYVDQNNDGQLTPDDFVVFGSEMPDLTFSSNMGFSWKNLRLDMFWQGVAGSDKIMTGAIMEHGIWGGFTHEIYSDYWTPDNPGAAYPRPTKFTMKNAQLSDFWMVNGRYLRLKNVRLAYTLPQSWCEQIKTRSLSVYFSATNLLTFSALNKYNIDPEMEGRSQESSFPQTSVSTLGININF